MSEVAPMHGHRLLGGGLALIGLALLFGQVTLLYGSAAQKGWMIAIGLPGVAVLSALGATCTACGALLAAAPETTMRRARRVAGTLHRGRATNQLRRGA